MGVCGVNSKPMYLIYFFIEDTVVCRAAVSEDVLKHPHPSLTTDLPIAVVVPVGINVLQSLIVQPAARRSTASRQ